MADNRDTADLIQVIKSGGAVILPTETVYGLFAKALEESSVNRVYDLKQRPRDKAMNLNVASLEEIYRFSKNQPDFLPQLFEAFLPGPLTIILQANDRVPTWVNSGLETVGFRLPNHPVTQKIIRETGPLIGPSANISGESSGKIFEEIVSQFGQVVKGLADDKALTGQDSTILDLSAEKAKILRRGAITEEDLKTRCPQIVLS
ncbi:L-threonylcarbamoyladenylate synthase [Streptococcus merionis]|uniref:L-threonylcarbamoyladenylate synthase n=1 Tax=Streptococcus merionis TaxID=400065 RepID=A0A239SPT6_9STRE|nr:L-threonylcarbamoyladenylate synthase [Streptococcus merionis]SNU87396.1 Sua5/YciO/YrdC/YwlC family protein [Streptococcus merionis]